ncbi:hypothetical protein B0H17DRAFT_1204312 [Mycena rosella]|uniref:Uncharacterized protein n=1 Tax=Mycena rosella TaxID=1033263 RepID=A0AAD7GG39_MYCRO|nr:hypothetical protein B0H17DRAFT_1204312 [Mycena rosella]
MHDRTSASRVRLCRVPRLTPVSQIHVEFPSPSSASRPPLHRPFARSPSHPLLPVLPCRCSPRSTHIVSFSPSFPLTHPPRPTFCATPPLCALHLTRVPARLIADSFRVPLPASLLIDAFTASSHLRRKSPTAVAYLERSRARAELEKHRTHAEWRRVEAAGADADVRARGGPCVEMESGVCVYGLGRADADGCRPGAGCRIGAGFAYAEGLCAVEEPELVKSRVLHRSLPSSSASGAYRV